jgi:hypothetical protein
VELLRRERWTGVRIAQATGLSRATVSRILVRLKLNKAKMLEPQAPILRYEHSNGLNSEPFSRMAVVTPPNRNQA